VDPQLPGEDQAVSLPAVALGVFVAVMLVLFAIWIIEEFL
jgi:hypothetical protein